jgi:hypothetical protein
MRRKSPIKEVSKPADCGDCSGNASQRRDNLMRRAYPALIVTVLLTAAAVWLSQGLPTWQTAVATPPLPPLLPKPFAIQGVSSCAAAACHNANGPKGSKGSEYTTWVTVDPHARAHNVLFEQRSQDIQRLRKATAPASEDVVCLKCHATYRGMPPKEDSSLADGVGCESCHGAAEVWKSTHYRRPFDRATPGFNDLRNNLVVRAEVCVGCHVGNADKDVNHDLIAAGHPRLRFECGAYLANYPRHWKEREDLARYPDLQARAWLIGQLVSAQASLDLLEAQCTNKTKPWPEFAAYDCYACHHDLVDPSWRQKRGFPGRKAGQPPMNSWYTAVASVLAKDQGAGDLLAPLAALDKRLAVFPRRGDAVVTGESRKSGDLLGAWRDRVWAAGPMSPEAVKGLLATLAADPGDVALANPDNAIQFSLGLAALHHALADMRCQDNPGLTKAITNLRDYLENSFLAADKDGRLVRYDSPRNLNRDDLEKLVREVQQSLSTHP